jgi:hypothetical protein
MSKSLPTTRRQLARTGLAAGAAGTLLAALTASPAFAAAGTLSLSATGGPSGGGNTIIATFATNPTAPNPTTFTASTTAQFIVQSSATATPTCPQTYAAPGANLAVTGSNLKVLSPTRLGVTVPTGVTHTIVANPSTKYALCVYGGSTVNTSALVASAVYSVGLKPTLASTAAAAISPGTGPALGGTTITVTGTNFVQNTTASPNNTTATLGGLPLKDINVASGGTSFTATTPAHGAGGPFLLSVTTPGGTASTLGNTTTQANVFSFTNGAVISPNTAPNSKITPTDVDVSGVGFSTMSFIATNGATPNSADAHVYLVNGNYNGQGTTGAGLTGVKTNPEIAECTNVLVVSDVELLCSLQLSQSLTNAASPVFATTRAVTISVTSGNTTITAAPGSFTQNDVGAAITVPNATQFANTTIASVTDSSHAVLTATPGASSVAVVATIASTQGTVAAVTTTQGSPVVTSANFAATDVGRSIAGTGIPANTYIVSVVAGTSATLSNNATASSGNSPISATTDSGAPVPNDSYNLVAVNDGSIGANLSNTSFLQSNVSSGSTFTVADY